MSDINVLLKDMFSEDGEQLNTRIRVVLKDGEHLELDISQLSELAKLLEKDHPQIRIYTLVNNIIQELNCADVVKPHVPGEVFEKLAVTVEGDELEFICDRCHVDSPMTIVRAVYKKVGFTLYEHLRLLYVLSGILQGMDLVKSYQNQNYQFVTKFTETQIKSLGMKGTTCD